MLTGSAIHLASICAAALAYPQANDSGDEYSDRGDARHLYLARVYEFGREGALALVPEAHRAECGRIELDALPVGPRYSTEVTFALDVVTGGVRLVGRLLNRDYSSCTPTEIPLTVDVVNIAAVEDGCVEIADYKGQHSPVPAAAQNWQLRFGALCATRLYGVPKAKVAIIRIREDGTSWWDRAELDALDLDAALPDLRRIVSKWMRATAQVMAGQQPDVVVGPHCRSCKALATCHAQGALIRQLAVTPAGWREDMLELVANEPRVAYERWQVAKAVVNAVGDALHAHAAVHPFEVGGGRVFGPVETETEKLKPDVVHQVLTARYGRDLADKALTRKATKKGIGEVVREVVARDGGKMAPLERTLLEEIEKAGGLERTPGFSVEVHEVRAPREVVATVVAPSVVALPAREEPKALPPVPPDDAPVEVPAPALPAPTCPCCGETSHQLERCPFRATPRAEWVEPPPALAAALARIAIAGIDDLELLKPAIAALPYDERVVAQDRRDARRVELNRAARASAGEG
jgi:hypothetical protein